MTPTRLPYNYSAGIVYMIRLDSGTSIGAEKSYTTKHYITVLIRNQTETYSTASYVLPKAIHKQSQIPRQDLS